MADEVRGAAVGRVAEVTFAAEDAVALLGDVGVQEEGGQVGEASGLGWGEVLGPVKVAAGGVGALEDVFESLPGDV